MPHPSTPPVSPAERPPRRSLAEMCGETLREVGLLVGVFGWLDRAVRGEPFAGAWAVEVAVVAIGAVALGMAVERLRRS